MTATIEIPRPQRWDRPFGDVPLADDVIDRLLAQPCMASIDPEAFPADRSLRDVIRNDARALELRRGEVLLRRGDYGSSIFVILTGELRAITDPEGVAALASSQPTAKRSWLGSLRQAWQRPAERELRLGFDAPSTLLKIPEGGVESLDAHSRLRDVDGFIAEHPGGLLPAGSMLGEIAALRRSPRTTTVIASADSELVEIRWQGLRDLIRDSPVLRDRVEALLLGRERVLDAFPLFSRLRAEILSKVSRASSTQAWGDGEWHRRLMEAQDDPTSVEESEICVVEEGAEIESLLVVLAGFARISVKAGPGLRTLGFLRPGDVFGLQEIVESRSDGPSPTSATSLRTIGAVDLLRIPLQVVREVLLPELAPQHVREVIDNQRRTDDLPQSLLDFLMDQRTPNGTQAMLIDTRRCIDCDDCVRACATTHEGNPRFLRKGPRHANIMIATACMHCVDPVCLIGCPTGAIHRETHSGSVIIDEATCIGCESCVTSCPYGNIQSVEVRDPQGGLYVNRHSHRPLTKATKCDLCNAQPSGPACVNACPHDALARIDLGDRGALVDWLTR